MENSQDMHAVLTGDIVDSSRLAASELQDVMAGLKEGAEQFARTFPGAMIGRLDVFQGDSWQLLMSEPRLSVRAAIYLRAVVRGNEPSGVDTRVALAWGSVDLESVNPDSISESIGEAFTRSGRALSGMSRSGRMAFAPSGDEGDWAQLLPAAVALADEIAMRWKPGQARAVKGVLLGRAQDEIAHLEGIRQPTVSRSLTSSGWRGIEPFIEVVENSLKKL